ncbi:Uncharacterised protein (plasmid) [Tsukamurella tyrosinosolvens]|uniref:Uncharacterized protein n=1 Tax=Tsukamurella tyrosinosolvens TaxID=57704 RepID=A0A1H4WMD0_TSUTY|nr:hypothetical protein [Tsukamurella tyrosinosolvens]KXO99674.1 hypothetical protein AXK58_00125 [Tsukamurella tyrosinosolvens]SEC94405.1 hypothetical protein SAMN04489793_3609 [Tsukamurella tyrosinosolvens]VEH89450.1 Uncharacterised protein [Tsukamurella tyrosinosolvens]
MTEFDPHNPPAEAFIVDEQGMPIGHMDIDKIQSDAVLFMYDIASTAGNDAETDRVSAEWVGKVGPQSFGYVAAGALSMLVRHILGPTLDTCELAGIHLRDGLRAARDDAHRDLGGAQ